MLIKKPEDIKSSEITDQKTYLNRRLFMRAAVMAGTATASTFLYRTLNPPPVEKPPGVQLIESARLPDQEAIQRVIVRKTLTPIEEITNYNNFYEFDTSKEWRRICRQRIRYKTVDCFRRRIG